MSELKRGDRVTVNWGDGRPPFNGTITGEGRNGRWWMVLRDGRKHPVGCNKNHCEPESSVLVGDKERDVIEVPDEMVENGCRGMYGKHWDGPPEKMPGEEMKNVWRRMARACLTSALSSRHSQGDDHG